MYPDDVRGTQFVMGWCGQADAAGYAMLALPGRLGDARMLDRDPVFDGAADPVLVWNPQREAWWMFYTQRRARLDLPGVEWCHGTQIGLAESRDEGLTWTCRDTLMWKPILLAHVFAHTNPCAA